MPPTSPSTRSTWDCWLAAALLVTILIYWVYFATLGFGSSVDTYGMLHSWDAMHTQGVYIASRFQGYLIPELALGFFAENFGHLGSNLLVLVISCSALAFAYGTIAAVAGQRQALFAVLFIAANPYWSVSAAETTDFLFPQLFFMMGIFFLRHSLPVLAAIAFACATSSRLPFGPMGLGALAVYGWLVWNDNVRRRSLLEAMAAFLLLCSLFYLPVFIASKLSLSFLTAAQPHNNGLAARLARFSYKHIMLFGWGGSAALAAVFATAIARLHRQHKAGVVFTKPQRIAVLSALLIIGFSWAVFFGLPARIHYLLPVVGASALLLALCLRSRWIWLGLVALELLTWQVQPDVIEVTYEVQRGLCDKFGVTPNGMHLRLHLKPGVLKEEMEAIPQVDGCLHEQYELPKSYR